MWVPLHCHYEGNTQCKIFFLNTSDLNVLNTIKIQLISSWDWDKETDMKYRNILKRILKRVVISFTIECKMKILKINLDKNHECILLKT